MRILVMFLIRCYQFLVAPLLGPCCRFYPSCSTYCLESVRKHGWLRGVGLGLLRLAKCHPFHPGGVDQVPPYPAFLPNIQSSKKPQRRLVRPADQPAAHCGSAGFPVKCGSARQPTG